MVCAEGTLLSRLDSNGGILTPAYSLSYHVFTNLHETRMSIGDFYGLAFCNSFNCSA